MKLLLKPIALVMLCAAVAGCQLTRTPSIVTTARPVCTVWKGISYSAEGDRAQTVAEVRANNAARAEYCR